MALNQDAFDLAREVIEKKLDIPTYYTDMVNNRINISAQTLVPCPLHDESTASFKYFPETESFYCFGCERGGSVIELHHYLTLRSRDGYTKSVAVMDLAKIYGIEIPNIFDESFINEEKAFQHKKSVINRDKSYPINWLLNEIEKRLKDIKKRDINLYIQTCSTIDNIHLVGVNTENKLIDVLDRLYTE